MATDIDSLRRPRVRGSHPITLDEVGRLLGHLRTGGLHAWEDARLFAFLAIVALAQLRETEALSLKVADVRLDDRTLVIPRRRVPGSRNYPPEVGIGSVLGSVLSRWLPRAGGDWLFPNQTRSGPWNAYTCATTGAEATGGACAAAGLRPIIVEAFRIFGKVPGRLVEPGESPFQLSGDEMTLRPATLDEMRTAVLGLYPSKKQHTSKSNARLVFDEFERMGLKGSSEIAAPGFIDRFAGSAAIDDISRGAGGWLISHLQTVCGKLIELGTLDASPFIGRDRFMVKARPSRSELPPARFKRAKRPGPSTVASRPFPVELAGEGEPSPWGDWNAVVCPMRVGAGGEVFLFDKPKTALSKPRDRTALRLFAELIAAYPRGFEWSYLEGKYGDPRESSAAIAGPTGISSRH